MYELRQINDRFMPFVNDREVQFVIDVRHNDADYPDISYASRLRGFHCALENGLVISTQWGTGNYCANRNTWLRLNDDPFLEACPDAELAAFWDKADTYYDLLRWPNDDTVLGYVRAEDWWVLVLFHLAKVPTGTFDLCDLEKSAWWWQTQERYR